MPWYNAPESAQLQSMAVNAQRRVANFPVSKLRHKPRTLLIAAHNEHGLFPDLLDAGECLYCCPVCRVPTVGVRGMPVAMDACISLAMTCSPAHPSSLTLNTRIALYPDPNMIVSKQNKRTIYENLFKGTSKPTRPSTASLIHPIQRASLSPRKTSTRPSTTSSPSPTSKSSRPCKASPPKASSRPSSPGNTTTTPSQTRA